MSDSSDQPKSAERVFLHDLSNQLVVAQGMGGYVLGRLKKREDVDPKELTRMEKTVKAIDRMIVMVKDRREVLRAEREKAEG